MTDRHNNKRNRLIQASGAWARGNRHNTAEIDDLRRDVLRQNHNHYLDSIPLYRKLAHESGCGEDTGTAKIKERLLLDAGIFKSYEPEWLDTNDYPIMNRWLSGLYDSPVNADVEHVKTIDDWIDALADTGIHIVYSSGTSGTFSFVPRRLQDWDLAKRVNFQHLAPMLLKRLGPALAQRMPGTVQRMLLQKAARTLPVPGYLGGYDGAFLGFRDGRMGNQALIGELAPLFSRHYYLYDFKIYGTAIRCLRHGDRTEDDRSLSNDLRENIIDRNEMHYTEFIDRLRESRDNGQKVFLFGAPYQFKILCDYISTRYETLSLREGSLALIGGGWKSFTGEILEREDLEPMISSVLQIPPDMVLEGYSMTEISALMLRCPHGRFHIPPVIEPVILDDELRPLEGNDVRGSFGFMDALATAYPGFIISGDYVHLVNEECECGLTGPAITEIARLPGNEIKGCGGIMSSLPA